MDQIEQTNPCKPWRLSNWLSTLGVIAQWLRDASILQHKARSEGVTLHTCGDQAPLLPLPVELLLVVALLTALALGSPLAALHSLEVAPHILRVALHILEAALRSLEAGLRSLVALHSQEVLHSLRHTVCTDHTQDEQGSLQAEARKDCIHKLVVAHRDCKHIVDHMVHQEGAARMGCGDLLWIAIVICRVLWIAIVICVEASCL